VDRACARLDQIRSNQGLQLKSRGTAFAIFSAHLKGSSAITSATPTKTPQNNTIMKRKVAALEKVDADLPNLQHKIRNDPLSYQQDFQAQFDQYASLRELFLQSPTTTDDSGVIRLKDLIDFVSHVADCYPRLTTSFATDLSSLLELHHASLDAELRDKLVGSLVLLRRKDIIDSAALLDTLWPLLLNTPSKSLRELLFTKIVSDLRTSNAKATNHKLNRHMQSKCYELVASDSASPKGLWSVKITRELWKRQVWTEAKAAAIMKEAALSQDAKVVAGGVRFFLGGDQEREEAAAEEDHDDEGHVDIRKLKHVAGINKKTGKRQNELRNAAKAVKKQERKKNAPSQLNFSALHLLHDPQGFAEELFQRHLQPAQPKVRLNLDQKILVLQLVSRLVGLHKLTLIPLYSYFIKFLAPKQPKVTSFLASLAQASHSLVPPDVLEPLIVKIANEFVSEAAAGEVASAGLNGIREVCMRQPLAMTETLLQDLVQYRKSKDKGVQMAARGLLALYREVGAEMLRKRDRGKDAAMGLRIGERTAARFGEVTAGGIDGLELLDKWKEEQGINSENEDEAAGWDNWDAESDSDSDNEGWINVESDGEIHFSDSEDDEEAKAKKIKARSKAKNAIANAVAEGTDQAEWEKKAKLAEEEAAVKVEADRINTLATTRILTPADLAKLNELRQNAALTAAMPAHKRRRIQQQQQAAAERHNDDPLTKDQIEGLAGLSHKMTKEEKIRKSKGDPEDDKNDHRSSTARSKEKKRAEGKSTTNKEKSRKKNFLMTIGKAKRKGKRSLADEQKIQKGHVDRMKRGGKRGNAGN
jgi:protein SDA1